MRWWKIIHLRHSLTWFIQHSSSWQSRLGSPQRPSLHASLYLCMSSSVCGILASAHWGSNGGNQIIAQPGPSPDKHVYISALEVSSVRHSQYHCLSCHFYVCPGLQRVSVSSPNVKRCFESEEDGCNREMLSDCQASDFSSALLVIFSPILSQHLFFQFSWPIPLNHPVCFSLPTSVDPH